MKRVWSETAAIGGVVDNFLHHEALKKFKDIRKMKFENNYYQFIALSRYLAYNANFNF